ncbi:unnamed protein product [Protopolystoma xenopodis]|uniref:Uncharacterized protein n=1 Tax=Protopolystoma xenopodis TaxID=117903 RepID=A0A448WT53_9PLAT|nr:unnamed protein product [Protopolystoma xenopodis]
MSPMLTARQDQDTLEAGGLCMFLVSGDLFHAPRPALPPPPPSDHHHHHYHHHPFHLNSGHGARRCRMFLQTRPHSLFMMQ